MAIETTTEPVEARQSVQREELVCADSGNLTVSESQSIDERVGRLSDNDKQNNPHAFVVMPFGCKPGPDGKLIDFNAIYSLLIKPALLEAGFKPFRADEETVSGDILTDMFQELLLADLVVVDMSIDNANVFYELGVRHALRKRGVVHIQSGRDYMPFDVFSVRTLPYHINDEGVPSQEHIERDKKSLIRISRDTWASNIDAVHSPVFGLLTGLKEPDTSTLCTPLATGFWREFNEWENRVALARQQKRVGDILLLTDEINNPLCKEEAVIQAGRALSEMGRPELALQEYREGLLVNPGNLFFRREEARLLNRMGRVDEAIIKLENLLADAPYDTRATSHLGRIYTIIWQNCWKNETDIDAKQQAAFDACHWAIKSMNTYLRGFNFDRNNLEPGMKALTLVSLLVSLADKYDVVDEPDADLQRIRSIYPLLKSSLQFSLDEDVKSGRVDFWTWSSFGNWHLVEGGSSLVITRTYRKALSYARKNITQLRASLRQVDLYISLGIHLDQAKTAADVLKREIVRIEAGNPINQTTSYPSPNTDVLAFLFSGHMLDREEITPPRFPPTLEDEVRRQIDMSLDRGRADANDHAFTSGAACGGDIIFIEACLARGMQVHVHMPCAEAPYVSQFVSYAGEHWIARYYALRNHPSVNLYYQEERVGTAIDGVDVFERNSRWALYASLVLGVDKLRLVALWDGNALKQADQDAKRVSQMVSLTQHMGGIVDHVDINKLEYLFRDRSSIPDVTSVIEVKMEDRIGLLRKVALFSSLHDVDLTQIARHSIERVFKSGEILATQGDTGDELFIIAAGEVSVRNGIDGGQEIEIARRRVGDYVGELALLQDESRMASLVAVEEVLALTIDQAKFQRILRARPETSLAITRTLVERLTEATSQCFEIS
ncbi:MAG: cyclic nucleotide-binding domain-containing protein [Granulosicoccus sp.]